jgi:hypothetical protein
MGTPQLIFETAEKTYLGDLPSGMVEDVCKLLKNTGFPSLLLASEKIL